MHTIKKQGVDKGLESDDVGDDQKHKQEDDETKNMFKDQNQDGNVEYEHGPNPEELFTQPNRKTFAYKGKEKSLLVCTNRFSLFQNQIPEEDEDYLQTESISQSTLSTGQKKNELETDQQKTKHIKKIKYVHWNKNMMKISLKGEVKSTENIQKAKNVINLQRCEKCFILHYPYQKFCRWAKVKQEKKKNLFIVPTPISEEILRLIKIKISSLEKDHEDLEKESTHLENISYQFFEKSCFSSQFPDICFETFSTNPESKGKLRGGAKLKIYDTDNEELSKLLSIFRSLLIFYKVKEHKTCHIQNKTSLCSFCLMRSTVMKGRANGGRQIIQPVEVLAGFKSDIQDKETIQNINSFFDKICTHVPVFQEYILTQWLCSHCKGEINLTNNHCIELSAKAASRSIEGLISAKIEGSSKYQCCRLNMRKNVQVSIFHSCKVMEVNLGKIIHFGGYPWKCTSVITQTRSLFRELNTWHFTEGKSIKNLEDLVIKDVDIAVYEKSGEEVTTGNNQKYRYNGEQLLKLRSTTPQRQKDRH